MEENRYLAHASADRAMDRYEYGLDGKGGTHDRAYRRKVNNTDDYFKTRNGGVEWKKHKYLYKVRTKTGKIRYVYELPNGQKVSYERGTRMQRHAQISGGDGRHSNEYRRDRKQTAEDIGWYANEIVKDIAKRDFGDIPYMVRGIADNAPALGRYFTDQVGDVVDDGKKFMRGLGLPF